MPNEKNSATSAISSATSAARGVSIIVPTEVVDTADLAGGRERRLGDLAHPADEQLQLGFDDDERDHDLDLRVAAGLLALDRGLDERPHLHAVEPGLEDAEPARHGCRASGWPPPSARRGAADVRPGVVELAHARRRTSSSSMSGRNSCSGGSSSRTVTGRPSIASRIPMKSAAGLARSSSSAACSSSASVVGEDHPLHERQPVAEEHVLGAAEADALGAELARPRASSGRSAFVRTFIVRNSSAQPSMMPNGPVGSGVTTGTSPTTTSPVRAVDRDDVALAHARCRPTVGTRGFSQVDVERRRAADRGRAHAARDDRGVAHETAARREDALGRDHAVQVVGRRLRPHEDHRARPRSWRRLGVVGGEVHLADRRARRRVQALGEHVVLRVGVELRVQQLVELRGLDPQHRLALVDEALALHLDGHPQRGRGGALADAGLEDEEPALLDRELDVAHVAVVVLELLHHLEQLAGGTRGSRCPSRRAAR